MCDRAAWVPSSLPHPFRDRTWWDNGIAAPATPLQADGHEPRPRILGADGRPAPRRVHGIGFRAEMIQEGRS